MELQFPTACCNFLNVKFSFDLSLNHSQLTDNGFVTFGNPRVSSNRPKTFPITEGSLTAQKAAMFAPYWSDVDIRCGGNIFYRVTKDTTLLAQIYQDVLRSPDAADFSFPQEALVITFVNVAHTSFPCDTTVSSHLLN